MSHYQRYERIRVIRGRYQGMQGSIVQIEDGPEHEPYLSYTVRLDGSGKMEQFAVEWLDSLEKFEEPKKSRNPAE